MKRSLKMLGLTLTVAFAFSGIVAASAFANLEFYTGGVTLEKTEPVVGTSTTVSTFSSTIGGVALTLTSAAGKATSTGSIDNGTLGVNAMGHVTGGFQTFTGVTIDGAFSKCSVEDTVTKTPGTIKTNVLTGTAETPDFVKFTPETKESITFVTLKFTNGSGACPILNQEFPITGSARATTNGDLLEFLTTTGSALKLGAIAATFTGTFTQTATGVPVEAK